MINAPAASREQGGRAAAHRRLMVLSARERE
jgi:hypothetical protein